MTLSLGYKLSSEEQSPWTDRQGQSPFVWSVLGAIGQATRRLVVGTAVTCPTVRIHPVIIAQAAATTAVNAALTVSESRPQGPPLVYRWRDA